MITCLMHGRTPFNLSRVIPGCARLRADPEIQTPRGYPGFRVRAVRPRNDELPVNRVPDPVRRRGHGEIVVADCVGDGVDDGGGCADRASLAAPLDAERVARTQR